MGEIPDESPAILPVKLHRNATPQIHVFTCAIPMPKPSKVIFYIEVSHQNAIPMMKPTQFQRRNRRRIITDFAHVNTPLKRDFKCKSDKM